MLEIMEKLQTAPRFNSTIDQQSIAGQKLVDPTSTASGWNKQSWKNCSARQQPVWPEPAEVANTQTQLEALPPLVEVEDIRTLKHQLAQAANGQTFILQGGDCSENFSTDNISKIDSTCKTLAFMAGIIGSKTGRQPIKVGRLAGQFAKPRSSDTETVNNMVYPSYRGDLVNQAALSLVARIPDPRRMLKGYTMARECLDHLATYTMSRYLSLSQYGDWTRELHNLPLLYTRHREMIDSIRQSLALNDQSIKESRALFYDQEQVYTSHEALLLPYEEALIRREYSDGRWYDSSAHMLWIGERTRQLDSAHVEMMRGVANPIGVKIGPDHDRAEIKKLCEILNPANEPGRLSLIIRFGKERINDLLPPLLREIEGTGHKVVWISDPMHGNTFTSPSGYKTRKYDDILSELQSFFAIHAQEGTVAGGMHLEMTGEDVTECMGGSQQIGDLDLSSRYLTSCDPRLNATQSLEIALDAARIIGFWQTL